MKTVIKILLMPLVALASLPLVTVLGTWHVCRDFWLGGEEDQE